MSTTTTELDTIAGYVQLRHAELTRRDTARVYATPKDVAAIATKLAQEYYGVFNDHGLKVALVKCQALMVYAMELYGCSFEDVVDMADYAVAKVVAGITPDMRLPQGSLRSLEHSSSLMRAEPAAHLVKLAEIIAVACRVEQYTSEEKRMHAERIKAWVEDAVAVLPSIQHHLNDNTRMRGPLKATRLRIAAICKSVDQSRRPVAQAIVDAEPI